MDNATLWASTLETLAATEPSTFKVYLAQTGIDQVTTTANGFLVAIAVSNPWAQKLIEERFRHKLETTLTSILGGPTQIHFVVKKVAPTAAEESENAPPLFNLETQNNLEKAQQVNLFKEALNRSKLRKEYTFENFAVSPTNEVAYAGATAVAKNPGTAYNPLFLYGDVGVGKTHLMHAVGIRYLQENPQMKVVYCMGEQFTNEIIEAIQNKKTPEFRNRYRPSQALLIDDIQFIAGKNTVQEEFFHTFNAITSAGGQVILTSDRPPHEIKLLEDRLRSRFEEGLTIDIQAPNFELRTAILLIKAKQMGKSLAMDVAQTIAHHVTSTRKLQGFLAQLFTEAEQKHRVISSDFALELLKKESGKEEGSTPPMIPRMVLRPREMIQIVAKHYHLMESQLTGPKRSRPIVVPRQLTMYIMRMDLGISYPEIGGYFGGRDHTTVMHSVEKIEREAMSSEIIQLELSTIRRLVYG